MSETEKYEITNKDIFKDKTLKHLSWITPILLSVPIAFILFIVGLVSSTPASRLFFFFTAFVWLIGGFLLGITISLLLLYYRSRWLSNLRERIAADGIKTNEIDWFKNEMMSAEKKALEDIQSKDPVLGDAYRETLAARLTASRILKKTKQELLDIQRRQRKLEMIQTERAREVIEELQQDKQKLEELKKKAEQMLAEAQMKLQMIEVAFYHNKEIGNVELTLKKLSARTSELPLALEAIKIEKQIRDQLEKEIEDLSR